MSVPEMILKRHPDCFLCQLSERYKPTFMSVGFIPYHVEDGFALECPATKEQYEEWGDNIYKASFRREPI